jgi:hypothetical protein
MRTVTLNKLTARLTGDDDLALGQGGDSIRGTLSPCTAWIVSSEPPHRLRLRRLLLHQRRLLLLHLLLLLWRAAAVAARPGLHLSTPALHASCAAWAAWGRRTSLRAFQ